MNTYITVYCNVNLWKAETGTAYHKGQMVLNFPVLEICFEGIFVMYVKQTSSATQLHSNVTNHAKYKTTTVILKIKSQKLNSLCLIKSSLLCNRSSAGPDLKFLM
jgi:hypothetical protein